MVVPLIAKARVKAARMARFGRVNMANQPPVVTGSNHSYSTNHPVLASDLFQASDPDGSVATYRFYDSSPGAGYFTFNGVQIDGKSTRLTSSHLSNSYA